MTTTYEARRVTIDTGVYGWLAGIELHSPRTHRSVAQYFGGARYAQAPVGVLRFRKTRALAPGFSYGTEHNPADCSKFCNVCPQTDWPGVFEPSDRTRWDEDCVQVNIWVPTTGTPPASGWPVLFHIHGGFLQFGEPNKAMDVIARMYEETDFRAIVVMPAYRVNMFGFLASRELEEEAQADGEHAGNMGFWDQRTALEWTAKVIGTFGGDENNITVSGYSAGAHSVFHQISYDLYLPLEQSLIRRAIMWSNGSGVQPKTLAEHQLAFDGLLDALFIDRALNVAEKLNALRHVPSPDLIACIESLPHSQFRGTTDDTFVRKSLFNDIASGAYARRMRERGVQLMIGDCQDEHNLYRAWRPPKKQSYEALRWRLSEDYPVTVVDKILGLYAPNQRLSDTHKDWIDLFGYIYADLQVHCLERGFLHCLAKEFQDPSEHILRYRIEKRMECADAFLPREWAVTHATDDALWWWGNGWSATNQSSDSIGKRAEPGKLSIGLMSDEKEACKPLFSAFTNFVRGGMPEILDMPQLGWREVRAQHIGLQIRYALRLRSDGATDLYCEDSEVWDKALKVWDVVNTGLLATGSGEIAG